MQIPHETRIGNYRYRILSLVFMASRSYSEGIKLYRDRLKEEIVDHPVIS